METNDANSIVNWSYSFNFKVHYGVHNNHVSYCLFCRKILRVEVLSVMLLLKHV